MSRYRLTAEEINARNRLTDPTAFRKQDYRAAAKYLLLQYPNRIYPRHISLRESLRCNSNHD